MNGEEKTALWLDLRKEYIDDNFAKLQEYLRWHKPILAFDGRPNLFFKDGRNALLAKDGDYTPLIKRLASDPALCKELADNARIPATAIITSARRYEQSKQPIATTASNTGNAIQQPG